MQSRETWTIIELEILNQSISLCEVSPLDSIFNWEAISFQLISKGFNRSPMQCREQSLNQFHPKTNTRIRQGKMDANWEQAVVFAVQTKEEPLEGDFQVHRQPERQFRQKPILCPDEKRPAKGVSIRRVDSQHNEDQHNKTQSVAGLLWEIVCVQFWGSAQYSCCFGVNWEIRAKCFWK